MLEINLPLRKTTRYLVVFIWKTTASDDLIDVALKNVFQTKSDWIVFGVSIKTFFRRDHPRVVCVCLCHRRMNSSFYEWWQKSLIITLYIHRQHSFPHLYFPTTFWIYVYMTVCTCVEFCFSQLNFNWIEPFQCPFFEQKLSFKFVNYL